MPVSHPLLHIGCVSGRKCASKMVQNEYYIFLESSIDSCRGAGGVPLEINCIHEFQPLIQQKSVSAALNRSLVSVNSQ